MKHPDVGSIDHSSRSVSKAADLEAKTGWRESGDRNTSKNRSKPQWARIRCVGSAGLFVTPKQRTPCSFRACSASGTPEYGTDFFQPPPPSYASRKLYSSSAS